MDDKVTMVSTQLNSSTRIHTDHARCQAASELLLLEATMQKSWEVTLRILLLLLSPSPVQVDPQLVLRTSSLVRPDDSRPSTPANAVFRCEVRIYVHCPDTTRLGLS